MRRIIYLILLASFAVIPCAAKAENAEITFGYFPNVTHAHALIAQNMSRDGNGWFESKIPDLNLKWVAFNAGPSAMEALFAGTVSVTYVGPSPALNAFIRSGGDEVRVISGAVRGGSALVAANDIKGTAPKDFLNKRIATPQFGNTQDISCRNWFLDADMVVTMTGGDVQIIPTPNSSMGALFMTGKIDAAWTVEPWVSRLEMEAGGRIVYLEPPEISPTTILVSKADLLEKNPELIKKIADAHKELTQWIIENPEEARQRVADELSRQTRREFPLAIIENAWPRLAFDISITLIDFERFIDAAMNSGMLKNIIAIDDMVVTL